MAIAAERIALPDLDLGAVDGAAAAVANDAVQVEVLAARAGQRLAVGARPRTVVRSASQSSERAR
jgi:hypothetical protein